MITVDEQLKTPLYAQIYTQIRQDIIEGRLPAGGRLPSSRMLAKQLQLSRGTVETAYDQLMSEGYIEGQAGRGCYVCRLEHVVRLREAMWPAVAVDGSRAQITAQPRYDCSPYGIDTDLFPHAIWQRLHRRVATEQGSALYESGEVQGEESLRAAIAAYLYQARQVHCTAQQIIIGAGADYLLLLLGQLLPRGLRIAMEQPAYPKACRLLEGQGFTVCRVSGDEQGMRTDALREQAVQVAYTMPSHQFPLGTVMPLARRLELIDWAAEARGHYIIEDDYDSEFRYRGKPLPALQGYDRHQCVIYIGTFSKSITPSIRIGYLVLPPTLLEVYQRQSGGLANTVSKQEQLTAALFLSEGYFERHINRMRLVYKQRYEVLCDSLAAYPGLQLERSDSGLHVNVRLPHMGTTEAVQRAARYGVRVYPVETEAIEDTPGAGKRPAHLMIGFSALSCEELTEAVSLLAEAWQL
ncbi:MAG: PLP-dependent aminotransferase family protein [Eubacteriales bacterium]|nr:PLP-dependent aminotransferase family protein [Eubacteriales bacterium]